jgi:hypothetical protein
VFLLDDIKWNLYPLSGDFVPLLSLVALRWEQYANETPVVSDLRVMNGYYESFVRE